MACKKSIAADSHRGCRWQRTARQALLVLGILSTCRAEAWTLEALLELPLERLMELRATPHRTAPGSLRTAPRAAVGRHKGNDRAA